jgi:transposase
MRARPKLTEAQQAKAIAMANDGATHAEIAALLHVSVHQIGDLIASWIKSNLPELQKHLRAFIDASLANGKQSMILPKVSRLVSRPVLTDYAKRYTITTRERLGCTWHLFAVLESASKGRRMQAITPFVTEHLADAARSNRISQAVADGKCRKCGLRPIVRLGKCSECREVIRTMNRTISCS